MRAMLVFVALIGLVPLSAGCRHVAGACDCEHSNYVRKDTGSSGCGRGCGGCGQTASSAAVMPAAVTPSTPAGAAISK